MRFVISTLALIMLLGSLDSSAQTNVSGPYFSNTLWSAAGSPYNLTGDVQIPAGVTLTIDPGCTINYTGDYEILIKGSLVANGTASLPIKFIGTAPGKSMIMFKSTNLSNSQLKNLEFTGLKGGVQLGDEDQLTPDPIKNSGVLTISKSVFNNITLKTKGYQSTASMVIDSSTISGSDIIGMYPLTEPIFLKNTTINNTIITSASYNYGIVIDHCTLNVATLYIGCCGSNITINYSKLTDSWITEQFGVGHGTIATGPLLIGNCEFNGTPVDLPACTVNISETIINNTSSGGTTLGNGNISCTKQTGYGSGTAFEITGFSGNSVGGNTYITNTSISQNAIGINIPNSNSNNLVFNHNSIFNNSSYNLQSNSSNPIDATYNWWGVSTSTVAIAATIFDYYDNINYGIANFTNYYMAPYVPSTCTSGIFTSVAEKDHNPYDFEVHPNPANEKIAIRSSSYKDTKIEIFNIEGKAVVGLSLQGPETEINISGFPNGMYLLLISGPKGTNTKKIMKY